MAKKKQRFYDVYGFDYDGIWFRFVTPEGAPPPRAAEAWPKIDKWSEKELRERGGDNTPERIDACGPLLVYESDPDGQFFSDRTLLKPSYDWVEIGYLDGEGTRQIVEIPKEFRFNCRRVIIQHLKDGSVLLRPMPGTIEREIEIQEAHGFANHIFYSLVLPLEQAKERERMEQERKKKEKP